METISKYSASPGTPLFPVSPERSNRQQQSQLGLSPSRASDLAIPERDIFSATHARGNSDVQGKVAQFNNLTKEAAQRRKDNDAALRRAILGREEAESETRRLKEENNNLRREIEEGRSRERKVGERLESVLEDFQRTKEAQAHAHTVYEKEVRRARKEAFKSSSALVNLQEELKTARNRYTLMRVEADDQKRVAAEKDREVIAAQSQVKDIDRELEILKEQFQVVQEERDALKLRMKEEEVIRSAAEGAIALPPPSDGEFGVFGSPRKSRKRDRESKKHYRDHLDTEFDVDLTFEADQLAGIKSELRLEKRMRLLADEQVHLLQIECQFGCCPCKEADNRGASFVHDDSLEEELTAFAKRLVPKTDDALEEMSTADISRQQTTSPRPMPKQREITGIVAAAHQQPVTKIDRDSHNTSDGDLALSDPSQQGRQISERLIDPCLKSEPNQETFIDPLLSSPSQMLQRTHPSNAIAAFSPPQMDVVPSPTLQNLDLTEIIPSLPFMAQSLPTPPSATATAILPFPNTSTTTSTVPLKDETFFSPAPATPGGISREEALEQIRARRGRARSYAAAHRGETPRKDLFCTPRREISAPAVRRAM